jgi:histidine ammonia-lyase
VKSAEQAAEYFKLSRVAGTDAHYGPQIGYGYTEIEVAEATVDAITKAIVDGHCSAHGQPVPVVLNARQQLLRVGRMVLKFSHRGSI